MLLYFHSANGRLFNFFSDKKIVTVKWGDALLICNNPEGENPHSAVFKLQLQPSFRGDPDGFKVRFGDSRQQKKKITPGDLLTHYYEIPGRYYAVLEYNNTPLDTIAIFLKLMDGQLLREWIGTQFVYIRSSSIHYPNAAAFMLQQVKYFVRELILIEHFILIL